jgi:hypothetical protein
MSGVFRTIDPPPPHRTACTPPPLVRGEDTFAGWRGGGGSIVRKTPDTALFSVYVSTLCCYPPPLRRSNSSIKDVHKDRREVF